MVTDTSRQAYREVVEDEIQLNEWQYVVYETVKKHKELTDIEISDITKIPINIVTARRNELVEKGLLSSSGTKINRTGKTANSWIISTLNTQIPFESNPICLSETQLNKIMKKLISANRYQLNNIREWINQRLSKVG